MSFCFLKQLLKSDRLQVSTSTMKCGLCLLVVPVLFSMLAYRYIQFMPEGAKEPVNQMKTLAIIKISDDIVSLLYNLIKIRCLLNVFFFIYNTIQFRYFQSRTHECRMSNYMYIKRKGVAEWQRET